MTHELKILAPKCAHREHKENADACVDTQHFLLFMVNAKRALTFLGKSHHVTTRTLDNRSCKNEVMFLWSIYHFLNVFRNFS